MPIDEGDEKARESSRRLVVSHYWSGDHAPYTNMLRDPDTDEPVRHHEFLDSLLCAAAVEDGDEVEIVVRRTGRRPFGDRRVGLVSAHTYERETP